MSEYTEQAERFIRENGLEFRAVFVGRDCPMFCEDEGKEPYPDVFPRKTHIHGAHYRCTISRKGKGHVSFDFWNSYQDEERNWLIKEGNRACAPFSLFDKYGLKAHLMNPGSLATVQPYDLLACLVKSNPGSFSSFCGDFGYDEDSHKAESIYQAVLKEWQKVRGFFTDVELEQLQEIA